MKALIVSVLVGCAATCPVVAASTAKVTSSAKESSQTAKPSVQQGMTAEEVVKLIGKPREVRSIVPEGADVVTGESWIYRRVAKRSIKQVAPTMDVVPMWGGPGLPNDGIINVNVPSERLERTTIYQMTALLFVDGKVVASKQWFERQHFFD